MIWRWEALASTCCGNEPENAAFTDASSFISDANNALNPSQTLQGGLTAWSGHTWDYEAQSENQPNPQSEELHKKSNKEVI